MLTPKKARELRLLIGGLREADDLANRYASGHTNHDGDEVKRRLNAATWSLENFINTNTEQQ